MFVVTKNSAEPAQLLYLATTARASERLSIGKQCETRQQFQGGEACMQASV